MTGRVSVSGYRGQNCNGVGSGGTATSYYSQSASYTISTGTKGIVQFRVPFGDINEGKPARITGISVQLKANSGSDAFNVILNGESQTVSISTTPTVVIFENETIEYFNSRRDSNNCFPSSTSYITLRFLDRTVSGGSCKISPINQKLFIQWESLDPIRVFDGAEWKAADAYVYTGETWAKAACYINDGSEWKNS